MPFRVMTLEARHWEPYRALMLEAYELAADAFTSTAAERRAEPQAWWVKRIGSETGLSTAFGAWDGEDLVGTVAIEYSAKPKTCHAALVVGMYVRPGGRTRGVGRALMEALVAAARRRPGLMRLTLTVTEGNEPALRLYRSVGFSAWGVQPMAIRTASGFRGKVHMGMDLNPDRALSQGREGQPA